MIDLTGKTILLTGASSGIGAATARVLGSAGATLIAHYCGDKAGAEEATTLPLLGQMEDAESRLALGGLYELAKAKAPSHPHPHAPQSPPGDALNVGWRCA